MSRLSNFCMRNVRRCGRIGRGAQSLVFSVEDRVMLEDWGEQSH